jgi:hypothetical protein
MRRLISTLAGRLIVGETALTGDVASADAPAVHRADWGNGYSFSVSKGGVSFFLGTPASVVPGSAAILKSGQNNTTSWTVCFSQSTPTVLIENGGLAMTSRPASAGADVTLEPPGNGGIGFASQQWNFSPSGPMVMFQNVKTGLYLRVRSSGPAISQPVTTGNAATFWNY